MNTKEITDELTLRMIEFDKGDPMRIHHFLKVHRFAQLIGRKEQLDEHTQMVLECTAILHDIGIHPAEVACGRSDGKLQEKMGPAPAREMLTDLGFEGQDIDRICFLIAHHHTYQDIQGMDYQILVEADFLVNLYEDGISEHGIEAALKNIFRTKTGTELCRLLYKEAYINPQKQA